MVERILPFFQRGDKGAARARLPKAWPDDLVLCRLSWGQLRKQKFMYAKEHCLLVEQSAKAVPILPGFDPVVYDRGQEQPVPSTPRLALDDADWKASHGSEGSAVVRGPSSTSVYS